MNMKTILVVVAGTAFTLSSAVMVRAQQQAEVNLNGQPVNVTIQPGGGFVVAQRSVVALPTGARPIEARIVRGQPYSAEVVSESIQTLADGNRIVLKTTGRVYRDSEGRLRREEDRASGGPTVSIMDFVAGTSYTLDPVTRTARETPARAFELTQLVAQRLAWTGAIGGAAPSAAAVAPPPPPPPPPPPGAVGRGVRGVRGGEEESAESLPDRAIENVIASGVRRTTTINKGVIGNEQPIKIVSEEWTSPELQVLVMTDHNDPRTGHSTYRLLNIRRLDPDPGLFQVPSDYTIQRPGLRGTPGVRVGGPGGRGREQ